MTLLFRKLRHDSGLWLQGPGSLHAIQLPGLVAAEITAFSKIKMSIYFLTDLSFSILGFYSIEMPKELNGSSCAGRVVVFLNNDRYIFPADNSQGIACSVHLKLMLQIGRSSDVIVVNV